MLSLHLSNQCNYEHTNWIIAGSQGGISFSLPDMKISVTNAETKVVRQETFDDSWNETFRRNDENSVEAIRCEASARCSLRQARKHLRTVLSARESDRLRTPVAIAPWPIGTDPG